MNGGSYYKIAMWEILHQHVTTICLKGFSIATIIHSLVLLLKSLDLLIHNENHFYRIRLNVSTFKSSIKNKKVSRILNLHVSCFCDAAGSILGGTHHFRGNPMY